MYIKCKIGKTLWSLDLEFDKKLEKRLEYKKVSSFSLNSTVW